MAASQQRGLAWLPCWLSRERDRELVQVLPDSPGLLFDVYALWPGTRHLPVRVRVAIDALAKGLPPVIK